MSKLSRRKLVAGAAGVAASPAVLGGSAKAQDPQSRVIIVSDVHIGDNSPTVWYQKSLHEPYLETLFDYVLASPASIRELVILGDFVDFWTCPPDTAPPTFAKIAEANPNILGPTGKLAQACRALQGRVAYLPGNHDMGVTQADLDLVTGPGVPQIRLIPDGVYYPLAPDKRMVLMHGHHSTMFNAPDPDSPFKPLPVGHFVTRAISYKLARTLPPGRTAADLPDMGAPNGIDLSSLVGSVGTSVVDILLNYMQTQTKFAWSDTVILPSGQWTTFGQAKDIYTDLFSRWAARAGGGYVGTLNATKAAIADFNGSYMPWFAQQYGLPSMSELVVFGHTHVPIRGLTGAPMVNYVNSGFECPSRPDMGAKHPTFVEVDLNSLRSQLKQVYFSGGDYSVRDFNEAAQDSIVYWPNQDFSTYVELDNSRGSAPLVRTGFKAVHGDFVVAPPERVERGERAGFWIQDRAGPVGSDGWAAYDLGGQTRRLTFGCPTLFDNFCSGAPFRTRSGDTATWGRDGEVATRGHPFYVRFMF